MKKIVYIIIFLLISMLSFFMLFSEVSINSINNIKNLESKFSNSYRIVIPNLVTNKDAKEVYYILKNNIDKYKGNIYYSRQEEENRNDKIIKKEIKYVYFNNLEYFNELSIASGRSFNINENESSLFLSTEKTNNDNQIGKIASIGDNNIFEVHTLQEMISKGLFDGYCYVQLPDKNINEFVNDLNESFSTTNIKVVTNSNYETFKVYYKWFIILGLYVLFVLIIIYSLLKSYKQIAIKRILGYSKVDIYVSKLTELAVIQILVQIIVTTILSIFKFESYNKYVGVFLKELIKMYLIEFIILTVAITFAYVFINKIRISEMLKNKQPTKEILIFNNVVKIILIVGLFIIGREIVSNFDSFKNLYSKSFQKWDEMNDYVILPSLTDATNEFMDYMASEKGSEEQRELYNYYNQRGAILADFSEFIPSTRDIRLKETKEPYESDNVWINPNYLKINPIYDIYGDKVDIREDENKEIILVPEKYRDEEKNIIEKHKFWNNSDKNTFVKNRDILIIWIRDGQNLFSYNLDVNPDEDNYVKDSFVNVRTQSNGGGWEYNLIIGYSGNPFKIKLDSNLSIEENVRPELEKVGYSRYVSKIVRVNEMISADSNKVKEKMWLYLSILLLIIASLILVLIQSIYNFFNSYKQYLAIRHLNGYGIFEEYKEYFSIILCSWCVISAILYGFKLVDLYFQIELSIILIVFELVLSTIVLIVHEKKKITDVIKGR